MKSIVTLFFCLFLAAGVSLAQKSKLTLADKHFQVFDFENAIAIYDDVLEKHPENSEALRKVSVSLSNTGNYVMAETRLKTLSDLEERSADDMILLADVLKQNGKLQEAADVYEEIYQQYPENAIAKKYHEHPNWVKSLLRDSTRFNLEIAGINSQYSDFAPVFMDDQVLFSSSRREGKGQTRSYNWNDQSYLNIFTSDIRTDSLLENPDVLRNDVNTRFHEGTVSYDPNEDKLYITRNNFIDGKLEKDSEGNLNLGIFVSALENGEFGDIEPFVFNNKDFSVGHPTLTSDGQKIYFVSDMPGGEGGTDIYYSEKADGNWSEPKNLGSKVNTPGNEMFPFLVDDQILYFASDGHIGLGGLDLYYFRLNSENAEAFNMGYPINTAHDDFGICVFEGGKSGYLSSNRPGGMGDDDIYKYVIADPEKTVISGIVLDQKTQEPVDGATVTVRRSTATDSSDVAIITDEAGRYELELDTAEQATVMGSKEGYFKEASTAHTDNNSEYVEGVNIKMENYDFGVEGFVYLANDNKPAENATLELLDENDNVLKETSSDPEGQYAFELEAASDYTIVCKKDGFVTQETSFTTPENPAPAVRSDFQLFSPEKDQTIQINNVYYDFDKYDIRKEDEVELNKLVNLLKANPNMEIEIQSHTDNRGSAAYNLELSRKRAASVVNYLTEHGIEKSRLNSKGFGEKNPVNICGEKGCSEWKHQENRRTEFAIKRF
jgi:outer membrane protein OmpA-like peptidoglycan-associated protein